MDAAPRVQRTGRSVIGAVTDALDARVVAEAAEDRRDERRLAGVVVRHPDCDRRASRAGCHNEAAREVEVGRRPLVARGRAQCVRAVPLEARKVRWQDLTRRLTAGAAR